MNSNHTKQGDVPRAHPSPTASAAAASGGPDHVPTQGPVLYLVATPIGTLGDFSPRAREVLAQVDFIACEDTRHSGKLLAHFGIRAPLESLHQHNEEQKCAGLIEKLIASPRQAAALVTDAGTPAVSDPGARLVAAAHERGVRVLSVPGPSSLVCALAASGFLRPRAVFSGFLPRGGAERAKEFSLWQKAAPCIGVFFESPNRVVDALSALDEHFLPHSETNQPGDDGQGPWVCVSRELSKHFEEHLRGPVHDVLARLRSRSQVQGECVVCVDVAWEASSDAPRLSLADAARVAAERVAQGAGSTKDVTRALAKEHALGAKDLYNAVLALGTHKGNMND